MSTNRERHIRSIVTRMGGRVLQVRVCGSGHYRVVFEVNGRRIMTIFSRTPSDRRGDLNKRAELKRAIRG